MVSAMSGAGDGEWRLYDAAQHGMRPCWKAGRERQPTAQGSPRKSDEQEYGS